MRFALYTNVISPHQLPLAKEVIRLVGAENYRYVYEVRQLDERRKLGWDDEAGRFGVTAVQADSDEAREWLENADVLLVGDVRPVELLEHRAARGLMNFYQTERWFKPPIGIVRMLHPGYRRRAKRMVRLFNENPHSICLAIGPHAAADMRRIGVRAEKIVAWGYFVSPSDAPRQSPVPRHHPVRILWVGRMLAWKRVDTILKAMALLPRADYSLTLVGDGPERKRLERLARGLSVEFLPPQPIDRIRGIMREHDVYVLSSNAYEGWGAVVSEALEEGMRVVGTYESGAPAAILPDTNLFHCGEAKSLARLLQGEIPQVPVGEWSAKAAAAKLKRMWES